MPKFTLICEHANGSKITQEFNEESITDVIKELRYFLASSTFVIYPSQDLVLTPRTELCSYEQKNKKKGS